MGIASLSYVGWQAVALAVRHERPPPSEPGSV